MKEQEVPKINEVQAKQGEYMAPRCNPFHFDLTPMGTAVNDSTLVVMYTSWGLNEKKFKVVDCETGVVVEITMPPPTWSQLAARYEFGFYYDCHRYLPYQQQVDKMGKCSHCGKGTLGYVGLKRTKYHWQNRPSEIHMALCSDCDSVFFLEIKQ